MCRLGRCWKVDELHPARANLGLGTDELPELIVRASPHRLPQVGCNWVSGLRVIILHESCAKRKNDVLAPYELYKDCH